MEQAKTQYVKRKKLNLAIQQSNAKINKADNSTFDKKI